MTAIELAPGVWRIPTFGRNAINSFAFEELDGSVTLVDAGMRGAPKKILASLAGIGKRPEDVKRILVTHAHLDHGGGLSRLHHHTHGHVEVHDDEAPYTRDGAKMPIDRASIIGRVMTVLPGNRIAPTPVHHTFSDNELLDVAGGLRVLHTPGHTPGHCSFLHEPSGVLITGDSITNFFTRMRYSPAFFCSDIPASRETADRLGEVDYEVAAFTHGPEIREHARERVRTFLSRRQTKLR